MQLRVRDIRLLTDDKCAVLSACAKILDVSSEQIQDFDIYKCSLDTRRGRQPTFVYTVDCSLQDNTRYKKSDKVSARDNAREYTIPQTLPSKKRPVIVGFGPAGIFCALVLCCSGQKPIILERGRSIDDRVADVEKFFATGELCTASNIQFGEGGAGTFSDGKLNTLVKDKNFRGRFVLEQLCAAGAPREILYRSKPHIGTDYLRVAVKNIRKKLINMGADILFSHTMTDLITDHDRLSAVVAKDERGERHIFETDTAFLALGHSARDTFEMLKMRGFDMERKPFSVGVRIEHKQALINAIQYDGFDAKKLPPADYKLVCHTPSGRTVYTFCMCPGGEVVAAASEENAVVTNGMSNFSRNGENANSALLVEVLPTDFDGDDPLAGMYFQRRLERMAYNAGGGAYVAPAQLVSDFLQRKRSEKVGTVVPTYSRGVKFTDLHEVLPKFVTDALHDGLPYFDSVMKGFAQDDAIMTAVESRSSSPVRILRNKESLQSRIAGIYPIGEGAGYAGGIMSAAMDGMRAAEEYLLCYLIPQSRSNTNNQ